jgi:hypothetical protein
VIWLPDTSAISAIPRWILRIVLVRNVSEFSEKKLELCGRCMMLLVEFLRPDAKQAPNR